MSSAISELRAILQSAGFGSNPLLDDEEFLRQWRRSPLTPEEFVYLGGSAEALRQSLAKLKLELS